MTDCTCRGFNRRPEECPNCGAPSEPLSDHTAALIDSAYYEGAKLALIKADESIQAAREWLAGGCNGRRQAALAILRHAPPPPDVQAWIPVSERLPKSSFPVLAFVTNSHGKTRRLRAHWIAKHTEEMWDGDDMDGDYSEEKDTTYTPEGWYETNDYEDTHWFIHDPVTHWMPLPAPPSTKGAES